MWTTWGSDHAYQGRQTKQRRRQAAGIRAVQDRPDEEHASHASLPRTALVPPGQRRRRQQRERKRSRSSPLARPRGAYRTWPPVARQTRGGEQTSPPLCASCGWVATRSVTAPAGSPPHRSASAPPRPAASPAGPRPQDRCRSHRQHPCSAASPPQAPALPPASAPPVPVPPLASARSALAPSASAPACSAASAPSSAPSSALASSSASAPSSAVAVAVSAPSSARPLVPSGSESPATLAAPAASPSGSPPPRSP